MDFDTWGNFRGAPLRSIDEVQGENNIKISIYKVGELFSFGYQLKVGTVIRQKAANIGGAIYKTEGAAREAAGKEVEAVCASNKNSKKAFADFQNILYNEYDLFGGFYERV